MAWRSFSVLGPGTRDGLQGDKFMMKSQDIIVLLKLVSLHQKDDVKPECFSVRAIAAATGISKTELRYARIDLAMRTNISFGKYYSFATGDSPQ